MKVEKVYICDYCGEKFACEVHALACEGSHHIPREILEFHHTFKDEYPSVLTVKMENGSVAVYKFEAVLGEVK